MKNLLIIPFLAWLSGCASVASFTNTSIVDYLYPNSTKHLEKPVTPQLSMPLSVGIAFVPTTTDRRPPSSQGSLWSGIINTNPINESIKQAVMKAVTAKFQRYQIFELPQIIPSTYIPAKGGFDNLDKLQTMYGIDIIALVSFDQTQFINTDDLSRTYWTLAGAENISGDKNDTATLMETAVYGVKNRKMIFRAPGSSHVKGRLNPENLTQELTDDSFKGFNFASQMMLLNLDNRLKRFNDKLQARSK